MVSIDDRSISRMLFPVLRLSSMSRSSSTTRIFEVYEGRDTLLKPLKLIGLAHLSDALPEGRQPHKHPRLLEICYLLRGTVEWCVGDQVYRLKRDDLFVTQPGEEHGGVDDTMHRCELYWMHVGLPLGRSEEDQQLSSGLSMLTSHLCSGSASTLGAIERLIEEHRHPRPFATMSARCALREVLIGVLRDFEAFTSANVAGCDWSVATQKAVACIEADLSAPHTLMSLAQEASVSERHLSQRFDAEVGMTPVDYVTHLRVEHAKEMLSQTSHSITEIALSLGFSSSQYFATIFRRLSGHSPMAYRKNKQHSLASK